MIYLDTLKEGKLHALFSPRPVFEVDEDNGRGLDYFNLGCLC